MINMAYTVKQLSALAGVSVRTLHHYDSIDLLKPAYVSESGYRFYEYKELLKLQQILFFKELKFSLKEIKDILHAENVKQLEVFQQQKELLLLKQERLKHILETISKTIKSLEEEKEMTANDLYEGLDEEQIESYKEEAKQRWGHSKEFQQSMNRVNHWSKKDMQMVKTEGESIVKEIAKVMNKGYNSSEVQALIINYHQHMNRFYDCSPQMFAGLGEMYVQDPRFSEYYEKYAKGLAKFMRAAMAYFRDSYQENQ